MKCFCYHHHRHSSLISFVVAAALVQWVANSTAFLLPAISTSGSAISRSSTDGFLSCEKAALLLGRSRRRRWQRMTPVLCASSSSNKGFGNIKKIVESLDKTYGEDQTIKYKDIIIDNEAAMSDFFTTNAEWHPLFRSIMTIETTTSDETKKVAALEFLASVEEKIIYDESSPWKLLDAKPAQQEKLKVVANWLDYVQASLEDIPVNEADAEKDDLDMHFINEGKRMLAITRFHVLELNQQEQASESTSSSSQELYERDELFMTCWSELAELKRADEPDTGSIILLPGYDIVDLRRFTDMNLRRPLEWLGVTDSFEIASFSQGVSAIRILHKLSDIPSDDELASREPRE